MTQKRIKLPVPYFTQRDNFSGQGWRECFTSSCAMLAAFYAKVANDDIYAAVRQSYGDTTDHRSHIAALRRLGLNPIYTNISTLERIRSIIYSGNPVAVGWLHHGPASAPQGGGHWSVITGWDPPGHIFMHDPLWEPDLVRGGHIPHRRGEHVRCSLRNWRPRWEVEGPGTGWSLHIDRPPAQTQLLRIA